MAEKLFGYVERLQGIVSRVDRTRPGGWLKQTSGGKKEWFFTPRDLKEGLCISKIKKGAVVTFQPLENRAVVVKPFRGYVIDKWEDED